MKKTLKKKRRQFSIGEIARRGLLKNRNGVPYANKGAVSKVMRHYEHTVVDTPHGPAKMYMMDQIIKANTDRVK